MHNRYQVENKLVADWLLHYKEKKAEYEQQRDDMIGNLHGGVADGVSRHSTVSDPTYRDAVKLFKLMDTEQWLECISAVEKELPFKLMVVLQARREAEAKENIRTKGRPAWIAYAQHKYSEAMSAKLNIPQEEVWIESFSTFSRYWDEIVNIAAREAAKRGLI